MLRNVMQDMDKGVVEVEGARLGYTACGPQGAAPVVAIHGASASRLDLEIALLPAIAENRRVLFIDRPGHGDSERPAGGEDPFVQASLIRAAADKLGAPRALVLGYSLGGAVALAYALAHPRNVSGLVLLAPVSHPWPGGVDLHHHLATSPLLGPVFRRTVAPVIGPMLARRHIKAMLPGDYYERARLSQLFRPETFYANSMDIAHLEDNVRKMGPRYRDIAAPTHIVVGDWDFTVSPMIHSHRLSREIPNARLTVLHEVGHMLQHDRPDAVIDAVDDVAARAAL